MEYLSLLLFIAGVISSQFFMPLLTSILELILTKCEVKKTKYSAEIAREQINMEKELATIEELKTNTRVIGFGAPAEEYADEDDLQEDDSVGEEPDENED